jgi:uncharacterized membrane protein YgcG
MEILLILLLLLIIVFLQMTQPDIGSTYRVALCAVLLLSACSPSDNQTPAPKLFKEQRDVLDKAKAVDPAQQQQGESQRKAIEQQTQ